MTVVFLEFHLSSDDVMTQVAALCFALLLTAASSDSLCARAGTMSLVEPRNGARLSIAPGSASRSLPLIMEAHASATVMEALGLQLCVSFASTAPGADHSGVHCFAAQRRELSLDNVVAGDYAVRAEMRSGNGTVAVGAPVTSNFAVVTQVRFVPSYAWQIVDSWQTVPPGMEVKMPLDGERHKTARIPPQWQLQLGLGAVPGFARLEVTRATEVHELRASIAATVTTTLARRWAANNAPLTAADAPFPPTDAHSILLLLGKTQALRDDETAETLELFERRSDLSVWYSETLPL